MVAQKARLNIGAGPRFCNPTWPWFLPELLFRPFLTSAPGFEALGLCRYWPHARIECLLFNAAFRLPKKPKRIVMWARRT